MRATAPKKISNIFEGVIIHVNGDTQPKSKDELCEIVAQVWCELRSKCPCPSSHIVPHPQHGGSSWYRPTDRDHPVTHTITHKLAQTKIAAIASGKKAVHTQGKVVTPNWILDSVAAGKRLSEGPYLVVRDPKQNQMDAFLARPESPGSRLSSTVNQDGAESKSDRSSVDLNKTCTLTTARERDAPLASAVATNVASFHQKSRLHQMGVMKKAAQLHVKNVSGHSASIDRPSELDKSQRVVLHIDLDCFFAQVCLTLEFPWGIRRSSSQNVLQVEELKNPALVGLPVAVSWADSEKGTGSISCANYAARAFGIRNGLLLRHACVFL